MDIPVMTEFEEIKTLTTHPLGIIIAKDYLVTVCSRKSQVLDDFVAGKVRHFTTAKRTRFMFQIFTGMLLTISANCARWNDRSYGSKSNFTGR